MGRCCTALIALSLVTKAVLGQQPSYTRGGASTRSLQQWQENGECSPNWETIQTDYFKNEELRWTNPACYTYEIEKVVSSELTSDGASMPVVLSQGKVTVDNHQVVSSDVVLGAAHVATMEDLFSELALHCFQGCPFRGAQVCRVSYGQDYGNIAELTINENPTVPDNGVVGTILVTREDHLTHDVHCA
jgi:hypothetical protein